MACPIATVESNLISLLRSHEENWAPKLQNIFNDGVIGDLLFCSCLQGQEPHQRMPTAANIDLTTFKSSLRLIATCIVSKRPQLMTIFLKAKFDDAKFKAATIAEDITRRSEIQRHDAQTLLRNKSWFFGINLTKYLRSVRTRDRPALAERNWLIDELLELMRKVAKPRGDYENEMSFIKMSDLTIRDSDVAATDRVLRSPQRTRDDRMSVKALGYLILDILWFIHGGGSAVIAFGNKHVDSLESVANIAMSFDNDWESEETKLSIAFEMVWIMIQPKICLNTSGEDEDNYLYLHDVFRRIWPTSEMHPIDDPNPRPNSISTNPSSNLSASHFTELPEAQVFRWIILRYQRDGGNWNICRMRIYRSNDGRRLRFDIFDDVLNLNHYYVPVKDYRFVPLYSYATRLSKFGMKLQPQVGSPRYERQDLNFEFQSEADVKRYQEVLTGRRILKDIELHGFLVEFRKSTMSNPFSWSKFEGRKWAIREKDVAGASLGRVQIWEVLNKYDLEEATEVEQCGTRGPPQYKLRFEMALFSENDLIIIGVNSISHLEDHGANGISITSKDNTSKSSLTARSYESKEVDDEKLYPGLPLFQRRPFGPPKRDGGTHNKVQRVQLKFGSLSDKHDLKNFIKQTQKPPRIH